jgi:uncharacterized protein (DUF1778 family)
MDVIKSGIKLMRKPQIKNAQVLMRTTAKEKKLIEAAAARAERAVSEYCRMQILKVVEAEMAARAEHPQARESDDLRKEK